MGHEKNDSEKEAALPAVVTCPVCGDPLFDRSVVVCTRCDTPHHDECWRYNEGCATFGCSSRISRAPRPSDAFMTGDDGADLSVEYRPMEPAKVLDWTVLSAGILAVFLGALAPPDMAAAGVEAIFGGLFGSIAWVVLRVAQSFLTRQRSWVQLPEKELHLSRKFMGLLEYGHRRIAAKDLLELELLESEMILPPQGDKIKTLAIQALCTDGSSVPLLSEMAPSSVEDKEALAQRWAAALGTTIRLIEGRSSPSPQLVKELVAAHVASIAETSKSPEKLLSPGTDDDGSTGAVRGPSC